MYRIIVFLFLLISAITLYANITAESDSIFQLGVDYFNGRNGKFMDREKGFNLQKQAAEMGNAEAQFEMGSFYYNGIYVERDFNMAFSWYNKAAMNGNATAIDNCGIAYIEGIGVDINHSKAVEYFERGAALNYAPSIFNLGVSYENGNGVEQNSVRASKLFRQAAELGDGDAQLALAVSYYLGRGVKRDYDQSFYWANLALENGVGDAANLAGVLCVDNNPSKGLDYFKRGYEAGDIEALRNYAKCLRDGTGCEADFPKAASIFEVGVNHNDVECTYELGLLMYEGKIVVHIDGKPNSKKTKQKGFDFITSSAKNGFEPAITYCNARNLKY